MLGLILVAGVSACGDETRLQPRDTERPASTSRQDAGDASQPDAGGKPAPRCDVPHFELHSEPSAFNRLSARVVDTDGATVPNTTAQACGTNICIPGETDSSGRITIDNPQQLADGAFKYGDGLHYAQFALLLSGGPDYALGDQITIALPPVAEGDAFISGKTSISSDAELTLAADATVQYDFLAFPEEEQHVFVARPLLSEDYPDAARLTPALDVVWALGPLKTKLCPPAELRVPNVSGIEVGSQVEFLLHSTDVSGAWAPYGDWRAVASGQVTDDGYITTDADSGIPQLGALGIRKVP